MRIVAGRYQPISRIYSQNLRRLIGKLLQIDPKKRPTMTEVVTMLSDIKRQQQQHSSSLPQIQTERRRWSANNNNFKVMRFSNDTHFLVVEIV